MNGETYGRKISLLPVWTIPGKFTQNAISRSFMNLFTSGFKFWNQSIVLRRFILLLPVLTTWPQSTFIRHIFVNFNWISLKMEEWSLPEAFCRKISLLPVLTMIGKITRNDLSRSFTNRFISRLLFWNQHDVLHRLTLILPVCHVTEIDFRERYIR